MTKREELAVVVLIVLAVSVLCLIPQIVRTM